MAKSGMEHQHKYVTLHKTDKRTASSVAAENATTCTETDENIVKEFVTAKNDRDKDALFHVLVSRFKQKLFEFIYWQVRQNQHDAEDLTQDVLVEIYQNAHRFKGDAKFSTYLFTIAKNKVLNYYRTRSRTTDKNNQDEIDTVESVQDSMTKKLELVGVQHAIQHAINKLNVEQRQILLLADKMNFNYVQISHILAIKETTVRSRLHDARKRMCHLLEGLKDEV